MIELCKGKIKEQAENHSSLVKRNGYVVDCFREATAYPLVKEREEPSYNLTGLLGRDMGKEMRRIVWSRQFNTEGNRERYSTWDRQVTPYSIMNELRAGLEATKEMLGVKLKESQEEIGVKVLEYFSKAVEKVPQKYHYLIVLTVVDLYCFVPVSRVA